MNGILGSILAFVILALIVYGAAFIDERWRAKNPKDKPFKWGYFQALCFFPFGLFYLLPPFVGDMTDWMNWAFFAVYGVVGSFAGFSLLTKKKKWAWLLVVILQMNLITWAINYFYGQKRWKEFR